MEPWEWQEPCVAAAWLTLGVCNHLELKPASPFATVKRGKQEQVMGESNVINDNNQDRTQNILERVSPRVRTWPKSRHVHGTGVLPRFRGHPCSVMTQQPTLGQALKLPSVLTTPCGLMGPPHQLSTFLICQLKYLELNLVGHPGMTNCAWSSYPQSPSVSFFVWFLPWLNSSFSIIGFGAIIPFRISFPFMQVFSHSLGGFAHLLLQTNTGST